MSYFILKSDEVGNRTYPRFRESMMSGLGFTAFVKLYDSMPFTACSLRGNPLKVIQSRGDTPDAGAYLNLQTDRSIVAQFEAALEDALSRRRVSFDLSDEDYSSMIEGFSESVSDYIAMAIKDKGMYWLQRNEWLISKLLERQKKWTFADLYDAVPCMQPISLSECEKYVGYLVDSLHYDVEKARGIAYEYAVYRRFFLLPPASTMKGYYELYNEFDSTGGKQ